MSNREALRALQTRLADRLQAARRQPAAPGWLAVTAGAGRYLLPLAQSGEIFSLPKLVPVPYTTRWFSGVVNLRGGLYGVADLAAFLGDNTARSESGWLAARLVTLNAALEVNAALLVDGLAGLRNPASFVRMEAASAASPAWLAARYQDAAGLSWQALDLRALAQATDFLNIGA